MASFKLFVLKDELKESKKFGKVRECGSGNLGLALAITVGYLDNLILSQDTCYNNFQFIDKVYTKYFCDGNLPLLSELIYKIKNKQANHNDFATKIKTEQNFSDEINYLATSKFFEGCDFDSQSEELLRPYAERLSTELNFITTIYDRSDIIIKYRNNFFTNAFVVSVYQMQNEDHYNYYTLYHLNYNVMAIENLNVSEDCYVFDYQYDELALINDLMMTLMESFMISPPKKDVAEDITRQFYLLKRYFKKTWVFEKKLVNACKKYLVGFDKCEQCKKGIHKYVFECGCKYCGECLNAMSVIDSCDLCHKRNSDEDKQLIQRIKC
ncbi:hypothetical protein SteCoe_14606 [Stentor coeruleus]|uniref:Uncharacterized protein n=1 Tax=Stentor coeruleus TaxID=5963 RepID=A0A1R2C5R1_9CILI|nr:hypothetical protein SteCoe_14606 [Stentor coeruleus]